MGEFVLMPKLGMTMETGVIIKWLCQPGDFVEKGAPLVEVETDKVNLEVESLYEGYLLKIYAEPGQTVPITAPIAYIGEEGEEAPELDAVQPAAGSAEETKPAVAAAPETGPEADLAVIGAGPGGYVAAIRAAQRGAKVVLFEKDRLGGVCLNRGCIPTKSLVSSADAWRTVQNSALMGIVTGEAKLDWQKVQERKNRVVSQLGQGVERLLAKHNVQVVMGQAEVHADGAIVVTGADGRQQRYTAKNIILATGTEARQLSVPCAPEVRLLSTDDILNLSELPESLAIIGGGIVGVEFAGIFAAFGVKVSIIELMPALLPSVDGELVEALTAQMIQAGIDIHCNATVEKIDFRDGKNELILSTQQRIAADLVMVAVGRKPQLEAFKALNLKLTDSGYVEVNEKMQTSNPRVYCIGDITGKQQLAHVASAQALVAADNITDRERVMKYNAVPGCVFSHPELAFVGITEEQAKARNLPYKVAKFPFSASGKALAMGATEGFVKIIADSRWDEILGVHIIGPRATDLIAEAVVAMHLEATAEELAKAIHAHPTLAEAIMEAAAGIAGEAIHI